jgi:plasmid maintenance system killer protein
MAKKIAMRIGAFENADSLADFWPPKSLPERCHELQGDHAGIFSVDLKQPFRMLFKRVEEEGGAITEGSELPGPQQQGASAEQDRWRAIETIDIVSIEDTHG